MVLGIIKQMNWVDIFVVILLFRICYVAIKNGIFIELFKLLGTVFACYVSLHYYTNLGDFFEARIPPPPSIPIEIWDFLALFILASLGYLIFVILRETFFRLIKTQTLSLLNKWGALLLGVARGFILCSLIIFLLSVPVLDYLENSAGESFSGKRLIKVSTGVYTYLWNNLVSKFMPQEKFNQAILEVQKDVLEK